MPWNNNNSSDVASATDRSNSSLAKNIIWCSLDNDLAAYVAAHPEMLVQSKIN